MAAAGGVADEVGIRHFGDPAAELSEAASGNVRVDCSHLAILRARGADAEAFLQGQFSNDVRRLTAERGQLSSYCTPKGRMLAILRLLREGEDILLLLPSVLSATVLPRLKTFILRSKVRLEEATDRACFGLSGPGATAMVTELFGRAPRAVDECLAGDGVIVTALPGIHPRYLFVAAPARLHELWQTMAAGTRATGYPVWRWLDIAAGVPSVWPETSEAFIPQTVNLELLGGVNFKKGCYPGQEIVARMQYLGKLKQRMYRARVTADRPPRPGDPVFAPAYGDQPAGAVVDALPDSRGGYDLLVMAPIASEPSTGIHLHAPDGPMLSISPPPYALPAETPPPGR
jgi:folate-binding protein YgfZ